MKNYLIARQRIVLNAESAQTAFSQALAPFETTPHETEQPVLELHTAIQLHLEDYNYQELDLFDFSEADVDCHFGRYDEGYLFYMTSRVGGKVVIFKHTFTSSIVESNITSLDSVSLLRFGLWMMFGVAINPHHAIAIHSSVIRVGDGAVLFLGESGTGKSTHTRLWREHIEGATLLNDDSPIIAVVDGVPTVFGSPWSGKTPCYKNESYPIRAIVRLSQAPHNKIYRLPTIAAIGALLPSCPPAFAYDATLQDNICATLSAVIATVPVYHLECLPDEAAVQLSFSTVFNKR
ncbi:MAG: hypothetical protein RRY23_02185 [Alistipes sp.]